MGEGTVPVAVEHDTAARTAAAPARHLRARPSAAAAVALVAVVAAPIVVGASALVGQRWLPLSDWASLTYRVSQVGTADTPLVGPYSFHGWAHPGPLLYWLAAPLYRLTGGDPRSLLWSGAVLNLAVVAALAAVAWRRGRWPLLLAVMLLVTALLHGFGPEVVLDVWNPYVPLLPFLLAVLLAWDAALGRPRALPAAAVAATFAVQAHLAFLPLVAAVAVWYLGWTRWGGRVVPPPAGENGGAPPPGRPAGERRALRLAALVTGVLWLPPLLDALVDLHNPANVARSLVHHRVTVGPLDALAVVGRYVRPDGRWVRGSDAVVYLSPRSVDAVFLVLAVAVVAGCLAVARRRRLVDVAALSTLTLVLLLVSVPATSQLLAPTMPYLAEWLKLVGGLVWFTAGWTAWRAAVPAIRSAPARRLAAAGVAVVVLVAAAAGADRAAGVKPPHGAEPELLAALRDGWRSELDPGATYRVEVLDEPFAHFDGLVYWMVEDGLDVVTADGAAGLKWGHDHRWQPGDQVDGVLTVAVHRPGGSEAVLDECRKDGRVEEIASYDGLTAAEHATLDDLEYRRFTDPAGLTAGEVARAEGLGARDEQVVLFEGDRLCGQDALRELAP
jgi:hypothetical protein